MCDQFWSTNDLLSPRSKLGFANVDPHWFWKIFGLWYNVCETINHPLGMVTIPAVRKNGDDWGMVYWLVVWLPCFIFPEILGISSSQLTFTHIFQRGFSPGPPTSWWISSNHIIPERTGASQFCRGHVPSLSRHVASVPAQQCGSQEWSHCWARDGATGQLGVTSRRHQVATKMEVSINGGYPNSWMLCSGKSMKILLKWMI